VAKGGGAGKAADVPQHDAVEGIDLETALSKIIGLEQVKLELQDLEAEIRFNTMRADRGIEGVEKAHAPHMYAGPLSVVPARAGEFRREPCVDDLYLRHGGDGFRSCCRACRSAAEIIARL
jgi:hypothetical protein